MHILEKIKNGLFGPARKPYSEVLLIEYIGDNNGNVPSSLYLYESSAAFLEHVHRDSNFKSPTNHVYILEENEILKEMRAAGGFVGRRKDNAPKGLIPTNGLRGKIIRNAGLVGKTFA